MFFNQKNIGQNLHALLYTQFLLFLSQEVVILIEKQFSFILLKFKNTNNHLFMSGTAKTACIVMHISFVQKYINSREHISTNNFSCCTT
jgi:hypothetical protein